MSNITIFPLKHGKKKNIIEANLENFPFQKPASMVLVIKFDFAKLKDDILHGRIHNGLGTCIFMINAHEEDCHL